MSEIFNINILVLEGGPRLYSNHNLTIHVPRSPDHDKVVDERARQDIQSLDNPAPTDSQAPREPSIGEVLKHNVNLRRQKSSTGTSRA